MTWVIAIILVFIAVQLIRSNKLKERKLEMEKEARKEKETDELLKYKYPHLFYDMKYDLRIRHQNLLEYIEDSNYDLNEEEIVLSHTQILKKLLKQIKAKNDSILENKINEIKEYSRNFIKDLSNQTSITESEKEYILFLIWGRIYEYISEPERILELDMETIKWWHEEYSHYFNRKTI